MEGCHLFVVGDRWHPLAHARSKRIWLKITDTVPGVVPRSFQKVLEEGCMWKNVNEHGVVGPSELWAIYSSGPHLTDIRYQMFSCQRKERTRKGFAGYQCFSEKLTAIGLNTCSKHPVSRRVMSQCSASNKGEGTCSAPRVQSANHHV